MHLFQSTIIITCTLQLRLGPVAEVGPSGKMYTFYLNVGELELDGLDCR